MKILGISPSIRTSVNLTSNDENFLAEFNGQIPVIFMGEATGESNYKGEHIRFLGSDDETISLLDKIENQDIKLEVVMSAENCETGVDLNFENGLKCQMPTDGYFLRLLEPGKIDVGDEFVITRKIFRTKIITLSDRASRGVYEDLSGKKIGEIISGYFNKLGKLSQVEREIIADDADLLRVKFLEAVEENYDLIFTTGGTGIGSKDITPETIRPLIEKEVTGIMEFIRMKYGAINPNALISRSIAGTSGKTLVYCLPGSLKAVDEYMNEIVPTIKHSIYMVNDIKGH